MGRGRHFFRIRLCFGRIRVEIGVGGTRERAREINVFV